MLYELFSKSDVGLQKNLLVATRREDLPLSEAVSADGGQAAWVLLVDIDSNQCLGRRYSSQS